MRRLTMLSLVILIVLASTASASWTLEPCTANAASRAAYRTALASAAPDTPLYTPHPFPQSDAAVIRKLSLLPPNAFSDAPSQMPAADREFFERVDAKSVRFSIIRLVNWNPLRCGPQKERAFYHVIRAFDAASGQELLRASVEDNGHVARVRHKPPARKCSRALPSAAAAAPIWSPAGTRRRSSASTHRRRPCRCAAT